MSSTLSRRGLPPDKQQYLLLLGLHPVLQGPSSDQRDLQRRQRCQQDHLLPPGSPSRQRQLNRLQLHLSSSLQTASRHKLSPRNPSLPSQLLLDKKCLSNLPSRHSRPNQPSKPSNLNQPSRHSRPSRPDLNRSNSSLASPSSLNSRPELPSPHRGDPRWSTRCSTPAAFSPRISQLQRTQGMVSTSLILPFCDCIYLHNLHNFNRLPPENHQCANKSRQSASLPCRIKLSSTSSHLAAAGVGGNGVESGLGGQAGRRHAQLRRELTHCCLIRFTSACSVLQIFLLQNQRKQDPVYKEIYPSVRLEI